MEGVNGGIEDICFRFALLKESEAEREKNKLNEMREKQRKLISLLFQHEKEHLQFSQPKNP